MIALGFALAALIGLSLGILGGGGSILTVPIFVYILGFEPKESIAMSLAGVGATSLFGTLGPWRAGNVNLRVALIFGTVAMAGTYLGARLAVFFSGPAQVDPVRGRDAGGGIFHVFRQERARSARTGG